MDPDNVDALCDRAELYVSQQMYEEAIKDYQKAKDVENHPQKVCLLSSCISLCPCTCTLHYVIFSISIGWWRTTKSTKIIKTVSEERLLQNIRSKEVSFLCWPLEYTVQLMKASRLKRSVFMCVDNVCYEKLSKCLNGHRSRSGRPGDCRTSVWAYLHDIATNFTRIFVTFTMS